MAFSTSDGFKSTNRAPMMAHKRSMERKSMAGGAGLADRTDPLKQPTDGGEDSGEHSEEEAKQVVAEHGPAHEVHIKHDHETGHHEVHTVHEDGEEHHSEHGSAEEAHEHAKHLSGDGGEEHEDADGMDEAEYE